MAENAANFTTTFQSKPSIFEVIAQKSLNDTLYPALQKVALLLSTNFPHRFGWLNNYYDESFLALNGLLQYYYLKCYDSSFSENFYGLKRCLMNDESLKNKHKELSLLFLVLLPYFKRKIEDKIQMYRLENADGYLKNDFEGRLKRIVIHLHTTTELVWGVVTIHNYLRYMAGATEYQLPILKLIEVKLCYTNVESTSGFWSAVFRGQLGWSELSLNIIKNGIATSLEIMAFFMQFLQMWNAQRTNYSLTDLPNVPAPPLDNRSKTYEGKCPLCLKHWRIPTVLPVSGYIFCFKCILRHLSESQKCPVTNLPAKPLDIVRLYIN